ncbi:MAG: hypothetical protein ACOY0T_16735 [Myxococcota bacterium]
MSLPSLVFAAAQRHSKTSPVEVHRLKIRLAKLVLGQATPSAVNQLELAERFVNGQSTREELADARQDAWTYIGSLACYCSVTDSASSQAVLSCLESDPAAHDFSSLLEQSERVLRCGVADATLAHELEASD